MTNTDLEILLEKACNLPAAEIPRFLGEIEVVRTTALARLRTSSPAPAPRADEMLDVAEAARRLGVSRHFLYRHHDYPFLRRMGRKRLYSANGIDAYIKNQNGGGR